jgi:hypothetical protein
VQHLRVALVDAAELLAKEAFGLLGGKAQVAQVELGELPTSLSPLPGASRTSPATGRGSPTMS